METHNKEGTSTAADYTPHVFLNDALNLNVWLVFFIVLLFFCGVVFVERGVCCKSSKAKAVSYRLHQFAATIQMHSVSCWEDKCYMGKSERKISIFHLGSNMSSASLLASCFLHFPPICPSFIRLYSSSPDTPPPHKKAFR